MMITTALKTLIRPASSFHHLMKTLHKPKIPTPVSTFTEAHLLPVDEDDVQANDNDINEHTYRSLHSITLILDENNVHIDENDTSEVYSSKPTFYQLKMTCKPTTLTSRSLFIGACLPLVYEDEVQA